MEITKGPGWYVDCGSSRGFDLLCVEKDGDMEVLFKAPKNLSMEAMSHVNGNIVLSLDCPDTKGFHFFEKANNHLGNFMRYIGSGERYTVGDCCGQKQSYIVENCGGARKAGTAGLKKPRLIEELRAVGCDIVEIKFNRQPVILKSTELSGNRHSLV